MRHRTLLVASLALTLPLFAGGVRANDDDDDNGDGRDRARTFRATLLGFNEVSPKSTPAHGRLTLRIGSDATGPKIDFVLTYADFQQPTPPPDPPVAIAPGAAHVHFAPTKVNGGVSFFFCGGGGKPACPPAPARVTGTVRPADIVGPADQGIAAGEFNEIVTAIRAGLAYGNVHTTMFPGGEIRGQLQSDN
jgi:hypothetical protein